MADFRKYSLFTTKRVYDWEKKIESSILRRHEWLSKIWIELYTNNPNDVELRKLSTDDLMKTNWFEKYGISEPNFN